MTRFASLAGVTLALTLSLSPILTRSAQADTPPWPGSPRDLTPFAGPVGPHEEADPDAPAANIVPWAQLVFQSFRDNNWEIYRANADGTGVVRLTQNPASDIDARLNRGATRIAFASTRAGDDFDIFTMNASGQGVTALTNNTFDDLSPAWSPDGARIAFESYRYGGNNGEVYVMNSNGGGETRLTDSPGYDGSPNWSPDGSKIAFVSSRGGSYKIWVMNADGSSVMPLSQPRAFDPAWSPDGGTIAYDADSDGDGWEELWLMNADGSNQRKVYDPSGQVVAWARSWSPDGRYVAFSEIAMQYYQGNLYWTSGQLRALDTVILGSVQSLTPGNVEWKPDLASVDASAPTSSIQPLPAESSGPFTVRWTGADSGGSGLKNYDIQVKENNGSWTNWKTGTTATNDSFPGIGGRSYAFRSRARDNAFNLEPWPATPDAQTTVESQPPQTSIQPLAEFSRNGVMVQWGGMDPGGSGIKSYDLQTSQNAGPWTNWLTHTTDTAASFSGAPGSTVRFRVRARDNAQNLEAWTSGADATTVLYTWAIGGQATDNRGAPATAMAAMTNPAAFHSAPSDDAGDYAAHVADQATFYTATWSRLGYGSLPLTTFSPAVDAVVDVVLPPTDDIVQNGGFEGGSNGWQLSGSLPPVVTESAFHSGARAAQLGTPPAFAPPRQLSQANGQWSQLAAGPDDRVHAVWVEQNEIYYAQRDRSGTWSQPLNLSNSGSTIISWFPQLVVQSDGTATVVWAEDGDPRIRFRQRSASGVWSPSETIPGLPPGWISDLDLAVDGTGAAHVAWVSSDGAGSNVSYSQRSAAGSWPAQPHVFARTEHSQSPEIVADGAGQVHLLWVEQSTGDAHIRYAFRNLTGVWSSSRQVSGGTALEFTAIGDPAGGVHASWSSGGAAGTYYVYFHGTGSAESQQVISPPGGFFLEPALALEPSGGLHVIWPTGSRLRHPSGVWGPIETLPISFGPWRFSAAADSDGVVHLFGYDHMSPNVAVQYLRRDRLGNWSAPVNLSGEVGADCLSQPSPSQPVFDSLGNVHMAWCDALPPPVQAMVTGPALAQQASESRLSQLLSVPAGVQGPTLSFLYQLQGVAPGNGNRLDVEVTQGASTTVVLTMDTASSDWRHGWVDLSPWTGQTITVAFVLRQASGQPLALAYLDEVSVGRAHPDLWVQPDSGVDVQPGQQVAFVLAYGNRGGVAADDATVTVQLPPELAFISAEPPPSATSPALRWDLGDLPAFSAQSIRLALHVAPSASAGSLLSVTTAVASNSQEVETGNNAASSQVLVGSRTYLPLIFR